MSVSLQLSVATQQTTWSFGTYCSAIKPQNLSMVKSAKVAQQPAAIVWILVLVVMSYNGRRFSITTLKKTEVLLFLGKLVFIWLYLITNVSEKYTYFPSQLYPNHARKFYTDVNCSIIGTYLLIRLAFCFESTLYSFRQMSFQWSSNLLIWRHMWWIRIW